MAYFSALQIVSPSEAKEIYEEKPEKVMKPVLAMFASDSYATKVAAIPCVIMDTANTEITPDSAAEVSIVTVKLIKLLSARGIWLRLQDITGGATITGKSEARSAVFESRRSSTVPNVIGWVTEQCLTPGVGDLLLSRWVMERLGYSPEKVFASAQQIRAEWDMGDVDDLLADGVVSVFEHTTAAEAPVVTKEERVLDDDEARACFPEMDSDINTERQEIRAILLEKADEAQQLGASDEFVKELAEILMQLIDVFRIVIGRDPPVDMPPMKVKLKPGAIAMKCKARRYSPVHRVFLKKHIDALILAGLISKEGADKQGRIWIPDDATELQVRVSTVVTLKGISEKSIWKETACDADFFVQRCLHCASMLGAPPQPRLLGEAMHGEHPNATLVRMCWIWVNDLGTHFKNNALEALQHAIGVSVGIQHHGGGKPKGIVLLLNPPL
ncbi:LOW QUALITY PROTEIN: Hypothetical protein PHPALM_12651 [Phytophthora palmivora]|uniref:Uncharacterized protein n=1 Tax=Phytophthora palmivora TaxID=4796 RepID=A0A2P4XZ97_9STRA|nr:LOW QUALITY PROTEIN: Hypothetical protein PHPALM_12651 [Phytophthora palmivora]